MMMMMMMMMMRMMIIREEKQEKDSKEEVLAWKMIALICYNSIIFISAVVDVAAVAVLSSLLPDTYGHDEHGEDRGPGLVTLFHRKHYA